MADVMTTWNGEKVDADDQIMVFDLDDCLAMTNKYLGHYLNQILMLEFSLAQKLAMLGKKEEDFGHFSAEEQAYAIANDLRIEGFSGVFGCTMEHISQKLGGAKQGYGRPWVEKLYQEMSDTFLANIHQHLSKNTELGQLLGVVQRSGWTLCVLTQGRRNYALGVLDFLEIRHLFADALILGRECVGYQSKKTYAPYEVLLNRFLSPPKRKVMVEDSPHNLHHLPEKNWETALVNQHVVDFSTTYHAPDITAFLRKFIVDEAHRLPCGE